jgi:DNA-binding transcriptional ArsR family regulator
MDAADFEVYELKAEVLKALAHPIRLAVADFLADGEQCVCDIADHVGAERSNVSRHLSVMVNAGVLESRKDGLRVLYSLRTPCVLNFLSCATDVVREQLEQRRDLLARL